MNRSEAVTNATTGPVGQRRPEMPGLILESDGVVLLLCVANKHKLAEIHPGNVLKIKDRRCKIAIVFDLNSILLKKRENQAA